MIFGVIADLTAEYFNGTVRDYLVSVHVKTDAGTGLEYIDDELAVQSSLLHFLCSLNDCFCDLLVQEPERTIGFSCSLFNHSKSANQSRVSAHSRDGIVLDRAGGLNAVIAVSGDLFGSERILFRAS